MSETERRILETAKKEFLERGFQGTSMRRISGVYPADISVLAVFLGR